MSNTQTLLQAMMWKQCVTSEEFKTLIVQIMQFDAQSQITNDKLSEIVSAVNIKIRPFNMMIRSSVCEHNAQAFYTLISTIDNNVTRMASYYSPKEYEYFKLVLTKIAHNDQISIDDAKKLAKGLITKNLNDLLDEWIEKHWFVLLDKEDDPHLVIGPRSQAELDIFIQRLAPVAD